MTKTVQNIVEIVGITILVVIGHWIWPGKDGQVSLFSYYTSVCFIVLVCIVAGIALFKDKRMGRWEVFQVFCFIIGVVSSLKMLMHCPPN